MKLVSIKLLVLVAGMSAVSAFANVCTAPARGITQLRPGFPVVAVTVLQLPPCKGCAYKASIAFGNYGGAVVTSGILNTRSLSAQNVLADVIRKNRNVRLVGKCR